MLSRLAYVNDIKLYERTKLINSPPVLSVFDFDLPALRVRLQAICACAHSNVPNHPECIADHDQRVTTTGRVAKLVNNINMGESIIFSGISDCLHKIWVWLCPEKRWNTMGILIH